LKVGAPAKGLKRRGKMDEDVTSRASADGKL
jgi:hypothetical protein